MQQRVYYSPTLNPLDFADLTETGLVSCVWELAIFAFERKAWIETILAAASPSMEAYLERRLSADV